MGDEEKGWQYALRKHNTDVFDKHIIAVFLSWMTNTAVWSSWISALFLWCRGRDSGDRGRGARLATRAWIPPPAGSSHALCQLNGFSQINLPTNPSTFFLLWLNKILSWWCCGRVAFLKLIDKWILWEKGVPQFQELTATIPSHLTENKTDLRRKLHFPVIADAIWFNSAGECYLQGRICCLSLGIASTQHAVSELARALTVPPPLFWSS